MYQKRIFQIYSEYLLHIRIFPECANIREYFPNKLRIIANIREYTNEQIICEYAMNCKYADIPQIRSEYANIRINLRIFPICE